MQHVFACLQRRIDTAEYLLHLALQYQQTAGRTQGEYTALHSSQHRAIHRRQTIGIKTGSICSYTGDRTQPHTEEKLVSYSSPYRRQREAIHTLGLGTYRYLHGRQTAQLCEQWHKYMKKIRPASYYCSVIHDLRASHLPPLKTMN